MIGYLSPVLYCLSLQCDILCFIIRSEKRRKYPVGGKALAFEEEVEGEVVVVSLVRGGLGV